MEESLLSRLGLLASRGIGFVRSAVSSVLLAALLLIATPVAADNFAIEVGTFKPRSAQNLTNFLNESGLPVILDSVITLSGEKMKRVYVGPYQRRRDAVKAQSRLEGMGLGGYLSRYTPEPGLMPRTAARPDAQDIIAPEGGEAAGEPLSMDALFGLTKPESDQTVLFTGFFQSELAYTTPEPEHYSKFRNILELGLRGGLGRNMKWTINARAVYDAVFDIEEDFYPANVEEDQRTEYEFRETYLDLSQGNWDFRIGRQHIIWGEMVGLFIADVVSARDLREPTRSDLDMVRIPQWATRVEYFGDDMHLDAIWIPYMTYDKLGEPGGEFFPEFTPPPGFDVVVEDEDRPEDSLSNSAYGLRLAYAGGGWDTSLFYYSSMDVSQTFARRISLSPSPVITFSPIHERIDQLGVTYTKDFRLAILKAEAVYTLDKLFNVNDTDDVDGLAPADVLDYAVSIEFSFPRETRLNLQYFEKRVADDIPELVVDEVQSGASLYITSQFIDQDIETQLLYLYQFEQGDWLIEPKVIWRFQPDWQFAAGLNKFEGPPSSQFGMFDQKDRVFLELRYSF